MDSFAQFQPLFAEALNNGQVAVCKWNESGTTIETALPELGSLTDDKEEWRAIIVRYIDDDCMAACETVGDNPYDFGNEAEPGEIRESSVPLIRLTQMLGGIPPLEIQFETQVIHELHKAPRTIYVPVENEEREQTYKELTRKYSFNGVPPSVIIMVTLRNEKTRDADDIDTAWLTHKESDSSEFWKRNHYPAICRFMVFDSFSKGSIQKEADNFNFWYSVMLLSLNKLDSGTLQAYRLYTVKTVMEKEKMTETFQDLVNRLRDAKRTLEDSIKRDIKNNVLEEKKLPDYKVEIPVTFKMAKSSSRTVRKRAFGIFSRGASSDIASWTHLKKEVETELEASIRSADRALDLTADRSRQLNTIPEEDIYALNRYQEEDLQLETEEMYHTVVSIQSGLPDANIAEDADLIESSENVKEYLKGRVMTAPAGIALGIAVLLAILTAAPAFSDPQTKNTCTAVCIAACEIGAAALFAFFSLIVQKLKLNKLIKRFNGFIQGAFNKVINDSDEYSDYLSILTSRSRGCSFLEQSNLIKYKVEATHAAKYRHVRAMNILLAKIRGWGVAYHLDLDFESPRTENAVEVDINIAPMENKVYAFETGMIYPVSVNNSGMTMNSPFCFADKILIEREELYDD